MAREIPLFAPELTPDEVIHAAQAVGDTQKYTRGYLVPKFEQRLTEITGAEHAISTSNGTTALHLGVRAMGWHEGDKILTSPLSFIATSNVILQENHQLLFGPVNDQLQLDMESAHDILSDDPSIQGIVVPHIYGHSANVAAMKAIQQDFPGVRILEDAAQAFAEKGRGLGIGEASDGVIYSFHENKVITTLGEGGALTLNDGERAKSAHASREQGRLDTPDWLNQIELGFNYRMSEIHAAAGLSQLDKLEGILDRRQQIADYLIGEIGDRGIQLELPNKSVRSWFGFYVISQSANDAKTLQHELAGLGIGARQTPMPAIYNFAHIRRSNPVILDNGTAEVAERLVNLPMHSGLSDSDVQRIVDALELSTRRQGMKASPLSSNEFYDVLSDTYTGTRSERHEYLGAVNQRIVDILHLGESKTLIDIGCGDAVRGVSIAAQTQQNLVSIDSSEGMIRHAREINPQSFVEDIGSETFDASRYKSDTAMLLWNVLGHIPKAQRATALHNVARLLNEDGTLILDVNNQFNAARYGEDNARRNREAVVTGRPEHTGDFTTTHESNGQKIKTISHIFHTDEIVNLLSEAGFTSTVEYINYDTGEAATEDSGQIYIVAKKKKKQL